MGEHSQALATAVIDAASAHTAVMSNPPAYTREQLDLLKRTVASGTSDDEFSLFIEIAKRSGLDPFSHQIYAIMRREGDRLKMTVQTGIDGYLAIAERSDAFAGVDDIAFDSEDGEHPRWARATVYRWSQGQRVAFVYTARWREYVQTDRNGNPARMWHTMGWTMLGKCALARALRMAFPSRLAGFYADEEMMQADNPPDARLAPRPARPLPQQPARAAKTTTAPSPKAAAAPSKSNPQWSALRARVYTLLGAEDDAQWADIVCDVTQKNDPKAMNVEDFEAVQTYVAQWEQIAIEAAEAAKGTVVEAGVVA